MDQRKYILITITLLVIASLAVVEIATNATMGQYLPMIASHGPIQYTINPCSPHPYPLPTAIGCPTATATIQPPNPYLPPTTEPPPIPTQTPWVVTATPTTLDQYFFLPFVEGIQR
jgi:hypothetical protein